MKKGCGSRWGFGGSHMWERALGSCCTVPQYIEKPKRELFGLYCRILKIITGVHVNVSFLTFPLCSKNPHDFTILAGDVYAIYVYV